MSSHLFILLFLTWLLPITVSAQSSISECGQILLPLSSCASFVQGMASQPDRSCCDNLNQLYGQSPACLCLLLNDTVLASFPINTTLALELPVLCNLPIDSSTCGGTGTLSNPSAPPPPVLVAAKSNSTVPASPVVTVMPRQNIMGLGFHHSAQTRLEAADSQSLMLLIAVIICGLTFLHDELYIAAKDTSNQQKTSSLSCVA